MDERLVAFARELERRDDELAGAIRDVGELERESEELRAEAAATEALLSSLPVEREGARQAVRRAEAEVAERRADAARAEEDLADAERSRKDDRIRAARRHLERAVDGVSIARRKLARAEEAEERLEAEAVAARARVPALERRAGRLAERLRAVPRISSGAGEDPPSGLAGTIAWISRARAALWVVRSGLESEREGVVREANELGASVLGETVPATSVSLVRDRIEQRGSRP